MKRREFLKDCILASAAVGLRGNLRSFAAETSLRKANLMAVCMPLVCSSRGHGFVPEFTLQSSIANLDPFQEKSGTAHEFRFQFVNPSGQVSWSSDARLKGLRSNRIEIPDGLGWGALLVQGALPGFRDTPYDNYPFTASLRMRTPWGTDGHHGMRLEDRPPGGSTYQIVIAPQEGEGILISILSVGLNPVQGGVRIRGTDGVLIADTPFKWKPRSQHHLVLGSVTQAPEDAIRVKGVQSGQSLFLECYDGGAGSLRPASWHFSEKKENRFFLQSHGGSASSKTRGTDGIRYPELKVLASSEALRFFQSKPNWVQMDYASLGAHILDQSSPWSSILALPNLQQTETLVLPLVYGKAGALAFAPDIKQLADWARLAPKEFRIPPGGVLHLDLKRHLRPFQNQSASEQGGILRVGLFDRAGLQVHHNLFKLFNRGSSGKGLYTVGHGHYSSVADWTGRQVAALREKIDQSWYSDQIAFDPGSSFEKGILMIGNNGTKDEDAAYIQNLSEAGLGVKSLLPIVPAGGFIQIPISSGNANSSGARRLISKSQPLSIATYLSQDGNLSTAHGVDRMNAERILRA